MTSTLSPTPRGGLSDAPLSSRNNNNNTNGSVIQRLSSFRSTTSSDNSNSKRHHSLRLFRRSSSNSSSAKKASSSSSAMNKSNNNKIKAPLHSKHEQEQVVEEEEEGANDSTMRLEDDEEEETAVAENVVQWMQVACPDDVLPKVLAFMGPQKTATLSRTNRFWRAVMQSEGTWRLLCEELYKWKHGDEEPASWAEHYRLTPCVPVDYSTVHKALAVACAPAPKKSRRFAASSQQQPLRPQIRPLTILLRPGNHYLQETIVIETSTNSSTSSSDTAAGPTISIQAVQMPENLFRPKMKHCERMDPYEELPEAPQLLLSGTSSSSSSSFSSTTSRSKSFRNFMRCHKETVDETATSQHHPPTRQQQQQQHYPFSELERRNSRDSCSSSSNSDYWRSATASPPPPRRACLVFRSKKTNEPAIRVRQGSLMLQHVDVAHHSDGLDIWNGNAAIQVQPAVAEDGLTIPPPSSNSQPTAVLTGVHVTSATGRGVVNIDGGRLILRNSAVTDCAATGVYIGGPGSHAAMERCDVLRNGLGNQSSTAHHRSRTAGIARGHSGVYLEQGVARIVDCNISRNTLTGISVVSPDNASLQLQASDLMANGTNQLELPAAGSWARQESVVTQNSLSVLGRGRTRSGLAVEQQAQPLSSNSSSGRRRPGQAPAFLHHHY